MTRPPLHTTSTTQRALADRVVYVTVGFVAGAWVTGLLAWLLS